MPYEGINNEYVGAPLITGQILPPMRPPSRTSVTLELISLHHTDNTIY